MVEVVSNALPQSTAKKGPVLPMPALCDANAGTTMRLLKALLEAHSTAEKL